MNSHAWIHQYQNILSFLFMTKSAFCIRRKEQNWMSGWLHVNLNPDLWHVVNSTIQPIVSSAFIYESIIFREHSRWRILIIIFIRMTRIKGPGEFLPFLVLSVTSLSTAVKISLKMPQMSRKSRPVRRCNTRQFDPWFTHSIQREWMIISSREKFYKSVIKETFSPSLFSLRVYWFQNQCCSWHRWKAMKGQGNH